jgi:dienelactone hydrolase
MTVLDLTGQPDLFFNYFPDNYRWSHGLLLGLNTAPWGGSEIGEVNRIGMELADHLGDDTAWFRAWAAQARQVEDLGRRRLEEGHRHSAAAHLFRAANYYHVGERFIQPKTDESNQAYRRGVAAFRDAAELSIDPRIDLVEIPYQDTSLPAVYVHPRNPEGHRRPAMVCLDGFDITKELQYFKGARDLATRGIAVLIVDGPGNGEAIRFRGLPLIAQTEQYATPAYEWLASRPDIDPTRIGVLGISLGGYYAPRAAAFEKRFACCVAWGAQWDYHATWTARFERINKGGTPSLSVPHDHLMWVLGVGTRDAAMAKLREFSLDGVAQMVQCPFLLLHGEGDEQIPLVDAQRCFDAIGSPQKTFRLFTRTEGAYHHCMGDNLSLGIAEMWDWVEDTLTT